jgi:uncharacterized protein YkwD
MINDNKFCSTSAKRGLPPRSAGQPWAKVFAFLLLLIGAGLFLAGCRSTRRPEPDAISQAVQATLTAWPTPTARIMEVVRKIEVTRMVSNLPVAQVAVTATPVAVAFEPNRPTNMATPAVDAAAGVQTSMIEALRHLINQQRTAHGLSPLRAARALAIAAQRHSLDMALHELTNHRGSDGSTAAQRIQETGYMAERADEVITWGASTPGDALAWLMGDELHRSRLLSEQFTELGIGYVQQGSGPLQHYWTIDLGHPAQPVEEKTDQIDPVLGEEGLSDFLHPVNPMAPEPTPTPDAPTAGCGLTAQRHYDLIPMTDVDTSHMDYLHGDLNLSLRGYAASTDAPHLIDLAGATDSDAPQLTALFADNRLPAFTRGYQVYDWEWGCGRDGCRGTLRHAPAVTLLGLATTPGEAIHPPQRNAELFAGGYLAVVLYADEHQLTLAYTRDGTVAHGYAVQLANLCVDPNLLDAYRSANWAGRQRLPALRHGQSLGETRGDELLVAIRDRGDYMDPRSRKDWWQ